MATPKNPSGVRTRPSLSTLHRPKPGVSAAPGASLAAEPAVRRTKASARGSEASSGATEGKEEVKGYFVRFERGMMRELKMVAFNEERPVSEIVRDAVRAYIKGAGGMRAVKTP